MNLEKTSLQSIGYNAFAECWNLFKVTLPKSINLISHFAFDRCSKLEYITIPNETTTIEEYAFENCSNLHTIKTPFIAYNDIKSNGKTPHFENCFNYNKVLYETIFENVIEKYVSTGKISFYKLELETNKFVNTESVRSLEASLEGEPYTGENITKPNFCNQYFLLPCDLYRNITIKRDGFHSYLVLKDSGKPVRVVKVEYETAYGETDNFQRPKIPLVIKTKWDSNENSQVNIKYNPDIRVSIKVVKKVLTTKDIDIETSHILKSVEKGYA